MGLALIVLSIDLRATVAGQMSIRNRQSLLIAAILVLVVGIVVWCGFNRDLSDPNSRVRNVLLTDRDGWPALQQVVTSEEFGDKWPFIEARAVVTGTILGLCMVEIDGETYALNGLAGMNGYPMPGDLVRKRLPWDRNLYDKDPGFLKDVSPVRDVALGLVKQVQAERAEEPFVLP